MLAPARAIRGSFGGKLDQELGLKTSQKKRRHGKLC